MLFEQTLLYALAHQSDLWLAVRQHVSLSAAAIAIAVLTCVPLGIWTARARFGPSVVGFVTAARVVPSLAVLAFMLPISGVGYRSALVALTLLACPPILINTDIAFRTISPAIREAAIGMGMRNRELLRRVEYPLALPVVIAGVRTGTVEVIASATLAAFIGGGGLGNFILDGLANNDMRQLILGGLTVALLALVAEATLGTLSYAAARRYGRTAVA
ncbi:MAG TPA: ABC transporter permease [Candidatus Eremiobacteraceae bacterium]|jgi:osmoprotectant transport system permease protein|nr:ABC transporter permease [Candidatus Eremiobacteraceae bacterium]